ncbi:RNAse E [Pacificibacter maritimus]|uniref:Ribonuclease E n=2 Tax=Pacificibacter maritimus TaxID=762213 RepID=A0A3N4ULL9_9RHOB|nr:RNAse E [Pacificibacter maritimus]
MLIDATHAEETRVVVVDGNKVEEFDFESENKRQLAGNIYLARVTRVEPSLQAAFIDYGGNRHGFLAFSEIHPDYYQIPIADREALLAEELADAKAQEEEDEKPKRSRRRGRSRSRSQAEDTKSTDAVATAEAEIDSAADEASTPEATVSGMDVVEPESSPADALIEEAQSDTSSEAAIAADPVAAEEAEAPSETPKVAEDAAKAEDVQSDSTESDEAKITDDQPADDQGDQGDAVDSNDDDANDDDDDDDDDEAETAAEKDDSIENVADDDSQEDIRPRRKPRARRYKIQEVIKVRQILLIQVVKEERGNKGAALTTYLSLAGRYCVLMPNTARGGGISRKITNIADRKKLKEIATEMDVPQGAGLIVRTAGAQRTKTEIKRDYDYLKRMWEQIRELTLKSVAPAKIYEEGDLIKRSIRDLYSKEIDEVIVEGDAGYRTAKDFMRMIMPTHAKNVTNYRENLPLFARYQVESYLGSMFNPTVQLKSGGYVVIEVTEALVSVDVNSGRSTKEGSIEDTALKTNLEAAEEVARQARLRDLAGLIVIDFIDMEERRNNTAVEKRLKDKLKTDRARIQVGRISGFGLLEMSRQRLRPGMLEATTQPCHHCHGTGLIRSDDNMALTILRQLEEEGTRRRSREVLLKAPVAIINYLVNMKREKIAQIEARYGMAVRMEADMHMISPDFTIEKFKTATRVIQEVQSNVVSASAAMMDEMDAEADAAAIAAATSEVTEDQSTDSPAPTSDEGEEQPKKRRRRRRRRRKSSDQNEGQDNGSEENGSEENAPKDAADATEDASDKPAEAAETGETEGDTTAEKPKRTRTRRSRSSRKTAAADVSETDASETAPADAVTGEASEVASDVAETPEPVAEKPKRTRTRRKKSEVAPTDGPTDAPAESATDDAAPTEVADDAVAEKPKRKRRKKADVEAVAAEAAEAEQPKPKRKRRTKAEIEADKAAKAAAAAQAETPKDISVEPAPAATQVEASADVAVKEAPKVEAPKAEAQVDTPEPEIATAQASTAQPEAPAKPKRKGWWSLS